jgi:lipopolysaccharide export system permease protein
MASSNTPYPTSRIIPRQKIKIAFMLSLAQRYIGIEILRSFVATTLILFIILMSNSLGRVLADVSEGDTPADALWAVLLGQSVHVFSLLLPLGFFLGVVFAFGRLYKDHELVVLHACGLGYAQLYRIVLMVLIPVLALSVWCSLFLSAQMQQRAQRIIDEMQHVHEFQQLKVGQFNISDDGDEVFFMNELTADRLEVKGVINARQQDDEDILRIAREGRYQLDEEKGDLFLEIGPGFQYLGKAGSADYQVVEFERHGLLIEKKPLTRSRLKPDEKYFSALYLSAELEDRVELWWRSAIPLSLLILASLAVPLAYIAPRQGRYGKIGVALLVFIAYVNLLALAKSALEDGDAPLWLNFWWVHLLFAVLAWWLLMNRVRRPFFYWRGKAA